MYLLIGLGAVAGDRGDVELVVPALLAVEDTQGPELGDAALLEDDLERRFPMVLVRDAERADLGAKGPDLGRHLDEGLVLLDKPVVAALEALKVQARP
jgi:hypothetical protein